jgi:hypothetical protein
VSGTTNLNAPYIQASQNQKEVTANAAFDRMDCALTETLTLSLAAGSAAPTAEQVRACTRIALSEASTAGRTLTLPAVRRPLSISLDEASTASVAILRGSTAFALQPGMTIAVYVDGSADGLSRISADGVQRGSLWIAGKPADGEVPFQEVVASPFVLLPDLRGWKVKAAIAAAATTLYQVTRNAIGIGTLTWAAGATVPALATTGGTAQAFASDDVFAITAANPADAALADVSLTILRIGG